MAYVRVQRTSTPRPVRLAPYPSRMSGMGDFGDMIYGGIMTIGIIALVFGTIQAVKETKRIMR